MLKGKSGFLTGFVSAAVLSSAVVWAAGEIYTPTRTWIQDALKYNPASADQINVLADIAPGTAVQMLEIGQRLNALNGAAKKQNWAHAEYQLDEMVAAFETLQITRPSREAAILAFLPSTTAVYAAITAEDKAAFKTALESMTAACNQCHVNSGKGFLVVKIGKSSAPIE
jgi:hypothetical protein